MLPDLDVIHDSYEPTTLSFFDHIFGFVSGVRQRGFQTTEEILRDGSFLTAVGELEMDGSTLKLQKSSIGPMFLTTASKSSLVRRFEEAKSGMMCVLRQPTKSQCVITRLFLLLEQRFSFVAQSQ